MSLRCLLRCLFFSRVFVSVNRLKNEMTMPGKNDPTAVNSVGLSAPCGTRPEPPVIAIKFTNHHVVSKKKNNLHFTAAGAQLLSNTYLTIHIQKYCIFTCAFSRSLYTAKGFFIHGSRCQCLGGFHFPVLFLLLSSNFFL